MSTFCWIAGIGLAFGALGARLGALRLAALLLGAAAGSTLLPWVGPALAAALAALTGRDTWAGTAAAWAAAYAAVAFAVSGLLLRACRRSRSGARTPPVRLAGAGTGLAAGLLLGWVAFGNFSDLVLGALPPAEAGAAAADIRRPFEMLRALRVLRSLDPAEAEWLASRPDVQGILESESLRGLLRAPGRLRTFSRAAEGDWSALASLAADPGVKAAMDEPSFRGRVRAVDLVELASAVERRRSGATAPASRAASAVRLPPEALESGFRERLAAEWRGGGAGTNSDKAPEVTSAADAAAYWRRVGRAMEFFDRPPGVPIWMSGIGSSLLAKPAVPPSGRATAD